MTKAPLVNVEDGGLIPHLPTCHCERSAAIPVGYQIASAMPRNDKREASLR